MEYNMRKLRERTGAGMLALLILLFSLPAFGAETEGQESQNPFTLLEERIPVQKYEGGQYQVDVYGSFTQLKDREGQTSVVGDNRLLLKRGSMIPVSSEMDYLDGKVDQVLVDSLTGGSKDTQYLSVLEENRRVEDYYEQLKWPEELSNAGIQEISSNLNTSDTVLMVRYTDNTVAAFNYVTGNMLFKDESEKRELNFGDYVSNWMTEKWNNLFGKNTVDYNDIQFLKKELEANPLDTELNGNQAGNGQILSSDGQVYNKDAYSLAGSKNTGAEAYGSKRTPQAGNTGLEVGGFWGKGGIEGSDLSQTGAPASDGILASDGVLSSDEAVASKDESQTGDSLQGQKDLINIKNETGIMDQGTLLQYGMLPGEDIQTPVDMNQMGMDTQALERHMTESAMDSAQDPETAVENGILTEAVLDGRLTDALLAIEGKWDQMDSFKQDALIQAGLFNESGLMEMEAAQKLLAGEAGDDTQVLQILSEEMESIQESSISPEALEDGSPAEEEGDQTGTDKTEGPSAADITEEEGLVHEENPESVQALASSPDDSLSEAAGGDVQEEAGSSGKSEDMGVARLEEYLTIYNPETGKYELYDTQEYLRPEEGRENLLSISQKMEKLGMTTTTSRGGIFSDGREGMGYVLMVVGIVMAFLVLLRVAIYKRFPSA